MGLLRPAHRHRRIGEDVPDQLAAARRLEGGGRQQPPQLEDEDSAWHTGGRNLRTVWAIPTAPYPGAHFATFPPALVDRCILAGSRKDDTVLDPFGGTGTVAQVAAEHGRDAVICDLNPEYLELARQRLYAFGVPVTDRKPAGAML